MLTVCKKNMCVGCKACLEVCVQNAIKICDDLDSYNAIIDEKKCIHCNACYHVCQQNQIVDLIEPIEWKQGWVTNQIVREKSSSGGLAAELMRVFLQDNGKVCSCCFKNGRFCFDFVESENDILRFVGSKYVKSDPEGIYKKIKQYLRIGHKVLFIGLPCQVAAVKLFCGEKLSELLYTVDLICHGTPSPMLLELFLEENNYCLSEIENIGFRMNDHFKVYCNHKEIVPTRIQDMYTFAFLKGVDYTENCYSCKYAKKERVSDITIGDSWGTQLPKIEQKKGISLILCQTKKGLDMLERLEIVAETVDIDNAIKANKQLSEPTKMPKKRENFFKYIKLKENYKDAIARCYRKWYWKQTLKNFLIKNGIIR